MTKEGSFDESSLESLQNLEGVSKVYWSLTGEVLASHRHLDSSLLPFDVFLPAAYNIHNTTLRRRQF